MKYSKKNNCPICRSNFDLLPPVNGLNKLTYKIHYDINNMSIYNNYKNIKCNYIFKKRKK
jgi:hypothetical protein